MKKKKKMYFCDQEEIPTPRKSMKGISLCSMDSSPCSCSAVALNFVNVGELLQKLTNSLLFLPFVS